eukprot:SAG31_NODE_439_length_15675_cov_6.578390_9_plen_87_part_00
MGQCAISASKDWCLRTELAVWLVPLVVKPMRMEQLARHVLPENTETVVQRLIVCVSSVHTTNRERSQMRTRQAGTESVTILSFRLY